MAHCSDLTQCWPWSVGGDPTSQKLLAFVRVRLTPRVKLRVPPVLSQPNWDTSCSQLLHILPEASVSTLSLGGKSCTGAAFNASR